MTQAWVRGACVIALTSLMLAGYQNCSQTRFDGAPIERSSASLTTPDSGKDPGGIAVAGGGTITDNPKPTLDVGLLPYNPGAMGGLQLCMREVKLVKAPSAARNHDAGSPGWAGGSALTLSPQGTPLASLPFASGHYAEVQVVMRADCGGNASASFVNSLGKTITLPGTITLRFRGDFSVSMSNPQILLNVQPLMANLAKAKDSKEARDMIEAGIDL